MIENNVLTALFQIYLDWLVVPKKSPIEPLKSASVTFYITG